MENLNRPLSAHYVEKAAHFLEALKRLAEDAEFADNASLGLLAVHTAISLNDAILAATTGKGSKGEDHRAAAGQLEKVCKTMKKDTKGIQHLRWLLSKKTDIAYGEKRTTRPDLEMSVLKVRRFWDWAFTTFREVLRVE